MAAMSSGIDVHKPNAFSSSAANEPSRIENSGHSSVGSFGDDRPRSRSDSDIMVSEYSKIPLALRAQVEAWDLQRSEILLEGETEVLSSSKAGATLRKCRWRGLDCVAKILHSHTSKGMADMLDELSVISQLRHPNLVLFLGACTTGEPLIILNEYLPCGNLDDYIKEQKAIAKKAATRKKSPWKPPAKLARRWCTDLARALSFLHSCPIPVIHRDVKPSNLLLQDDLHLKVSDFGLCKTLHRDDESGVPISTNSSHDCWKAPEILRRDKLYDHTVDIYSMGMIFWFISTGERPFENGPAGFVERIAAGQDIRPPLLFIEQEYGKAMSELIERCWISEPALRLSAEHVVEFLENMPDVDGKTPAKVGDKNACNVM